MKNKWLLPILFILSSLTAGCSLFISPEVVYTTPGNNEMVHDAGFSIKVGFSKPMDRQKTEQAFAFYNAAQPGAYIEGNFSWDSDSSFTFKPYIDKITYPAQYSYEISTGAQDKDGNTLVKTYHSRFNLLTELGYPEVINTYPLNAATNIEIISFITVQFSMPMDEGSIRSSFTITPALDGIITIESNLFIYAPVYPLSNGIYYTLEFSEDARSATFVKLKNKFSFYFTAGMDLSTPSVTGVYTDLSGPALTNNQAGMEKSLQTLILDFNLPMNRDSVYNNLSISPAASYYINWTSSNTASICFTKILLPQTNYSLILNSGAQSVSGKYMNQDYKFRFSTDGVFSRLALFSWARAEVSSGNQDIYTNMINYLAINNDDIMMVRVNFTASTDMSLTSLYSKSSISYVLGSGDPGKLGRIIDISPLGGNVFIYTIDSLSINNYYKFTLQGGTGGIEDVLHNPLPQSAEIYFTITNTN